MKYRRLGKSGLLVSELALGAMTFGTGGLWGEIGGLGVPEAALLVKAALESGVNLFDTADYYALGQSEEILAGALAELGVSRRDILIATKCRLRMGDGVNDVGCSRHHILNAVDNSLRRLKTDYIDIFQLHGYDPITPIEETLSTLHDLVSLGKVRYIGFSNLPAWYAMKAQGIAQAHKFHRFVSMQAYYNPVCRDVEADLLPFAEDQGVGTLVWSPLAGGLLSGKDYNNEGGRRKKFDFPPVRQEFLEVVISVMRNISLSHGVPMSQITLAWLLSRPTVSSILVGVRSTAQLQQNLGACDFVLTQDELAQIDAAAPARSLFPHWMIERQIGDRFPGADAGLIALKQ